MRSKVRDVTVWIDAYRKTVAPSVTAERRERIKRAAEARAEESRRKSEQEDLAYWRELQKKRKKGANHDG